MESLAVDRKGWFDLEVFDASCIAFEQQVQVKAAKRQSPGMPNSITGWSQFERIFLIAAVEPLPMLWHHLRATREAEFTVAFSAHAVSA
jgi:hypothetical protein